MAVAEDQSDEDPTSVVYPGDFVLVHEDDGSDVWPGAVMDAKFGKSAHEVMYLICRYEGGEPTRDFYRAPEHEVALHPTGRMDKTVVEELNGDEQSDT